MKIGEGYGDSATCRYIYLQDDLSQDSIGEIKEFFENNDMGYYLFSDGMIEEEKSYISYLLQTKLDFIIILFATVIISFISIGYVNKGSLRDRFRLYMYSGAGKKAIYRIAFIYYMVMFSAGLVLYNIFYFLVKTDFISRNFGFLSFVRLYKMSDGSLSVSDLVIIFMILGLISLLSSKLLIRDVFSKGVKKV